MPKSIRSQNEVCSSWTTFGNGNTLINQWNKEGVNSFGLVFKHVDHGKKCGDYADTPPEQFYFFGNDEVVFEFVNLNGIDVLIEELQKLRLRITSETNGSQSSNDEIREIPKSYKTPGNHYARTVGDLKKHLEQLPDDLDLFTGRDDYMEVVVGKTNKQGEMISVLFLREPEE